MDAAIAAAVEVPTGIPTGVPGVEAAAQRVITDGGITGALLILAVAIIVGLFWEMKRRSNVVDAARDAVAKAHEEDREEWQRRTQEAHDKRIAELRDVLNVTQNATAAISVFSQTQADRTATSHEIASKLESVALIAKNNGDMLDRNLRAFEDRLRELTQRVEAYARTRMPTPDSEGGGR